MILQFPTKQKKLYSVGDSFTHQGNRVHVLDQRAVNGKRQILTIQRGVFRWCDDSRFWGV